MSICTRIAFLALSLLVAAPASHAQSGDKDMAELRAYVLNMDNVTRIFTAMYEVKQASEKDPNLKKSMAADGADDQNERSIASVTAKLSAYPAVVAVIAKNHFTPHEFVVTELSLLQTSLAAAALKQGTPREKLIAEAGVNPANLDFIQQHQAELEELAKKYPIQ